MIEIIRETEAELDYCVRLHDLVLDLCQHLASDKKEYWHTKLIRAYSSTVPCVDGVREGRRAWWELKDDGYIFDSLSRHLVSSGMYPELELLLFDAHWTLTRMKIGGWLSLSSDFERLFMRDDGVSCDAMRKLHWAIKRSWMCINFEVKLFPCYVFGHLSRGEREF